MWRVSRHIGTMSDVDTAAPIGCPKTDIHAAGKCTNAAAASGSDAHRGRQYICGGARSGRARCHGELLDQKRGIARELMRAMNARRASGRVADNRRVNDSV